MWTKYIQSKVFSRVKQEGLDALAIKYPDIKYTTEEKTPVKAQFPTVYLHELPGTEEGADLEGLTINAVLTTIQVDVTDNVSKTRVREVMNQVTKTMKSMRFQVISSPDIVTNDDVHKGTARYRRLIAQGDIY